MEKNYITLVKGDGTEIKAEVIFTFNSPEFNKDYVVFIPEDFGGFSAASYTADENGGSLAPIETEEEWNLIREMLNEFMAQQQSNCGCCGGCQSCDGDCDCDGECDGDCCGEECSCQKDHN